jgi:hypothetical protein
MYVNIEALQLYLGVQDQFFEYKADSIEHRPSRWESQLVYIWEELNSINCKLVSDSFWTPAVIEAMTLP